MQALGTVRRCTGARKDQIEIHVAEPYAAEARLLESRLDVRVRPRTNDYELGFPAHWLAHRSLPIGSQVRVVNLDNGRSVVVRIVSRGPFIRGRVIDVSTEAAIALGFRQAGVARVRIDQI